MLTVWVALRKTVKHATETLGSLWNGNMWLQQIVMMYWKCLNVAMKGTSLGDNDDGRSIGEEGSASTHGDDEEDSMISDF